MANIGQHLAAIDV